jgi:hypothetical protein
VRPPEKLHTVLVDDLHALLAGGHRQARDPQAALQRRQATRHQAAARRLGQGLGVVQDQRRIHQHRAVIAD